MLGQTPGGDRRLAVLQTYAGYKRRVSCRPTQDGPTLQLSAACEDRTPVDKGAFQGVPVNSATAVHIHRNGAPEWMAEGGSQVSH